MLDDFDPPNIPAPLAARLTSSVWSLGGIPWRFTEDGFLQLPKAKVQWSVVGEELRLWMPRGKTLRFEMTATPDQIELRKPETLRPIVLDKLADLSQHAPRVTTVPAPPEAGGADRRKALAGNANNEATRRALVVKFRRAGRLDLAHEQIQSLREAFSTEPDRATAEALLTSLELLALHDECLDQARAMVTDFPDSPVLWAILGRQEFRAGQARIAAEAADRGLTLVGMNSPLREQLQRQRISYLRASDPRKALLALLREDLEEPDDDNRLLAGLWLGGEAFDRELFEDCVAEVGADRNDRLRWSAIYNRASRTESHVFTLLAEHLKQIVQRCRREGAEPMLVSYPRHINGLHETKKKLAQELNVPFVDLVPAFEGELRQRRQQELFDIGHCTDVGYAILAESVLDEIRNLLER
jgi:hypothetical protein